MRRLISCRSSVQTIDHAKLGGESSMRIPKSCALVAALVLTQSNAKAADITVTPGESIQKAIDSAEPHSTIHLAVGEFREQIIINKPLTLRGAGWDRTVIRADAAPPVHNQDERAAVEEAASDPQTDPEKLRLMEASAGRADPTISIESAHVTIDQLGVRGLSNQDSLGPRALVSVNKATDVHISRCGMTDAATDGIVVTGSSACDIEHCLVAAVWHAGIHTTNTPDSEPSKLHVSDCDIRNCYYAGISLSRADERDRQRQADAAPERAERQPGCRHLWTSRLHDGGAFNANPQPKIESNLFWNHTSDLSRSGSTVPLPAGNADRDPGFVVSLQQDCTINQAAATSLGMPTTQPSMKETFPVQTGELAIIPDGATRDQSLWKKPPSIR